MTEYQLIFALDFAKNKDHPWLQHANKAPNVSLGETVRTRLQQFSVMNRFKKKALRVSANILRTLLLLSSNILFAAENI